MSKTWLITGTSRGFGRAFTAAALSRGDRVVATARNPDRLADLQAEHGENLLTLTLDVTDRSAAHAAVAEAFAHFGSVDVLVNNAGFGVRGTVEELSEDDIRATMDTNFFGAMWVTQAALPHLRTQRHGHIIQISSVGGLLALPTIGGYNASKWALEGLTEALAQEVAGLGIHVTLVEPGAFDTDFGESSMRHADPLDAYDGVRDALAQRTSSSTPGDPAAAAQALLALADHPDPPTRVIFGATGLPMIQTIYEARLDNLRKAATLAQHT